MDLKSSLLVGSVVIDSHKPIGPRGFFYAGPVAWNNLQPVLKDSSLSVTMFKKLLKLELFN